ncbi:unnamed protein product [Cercospora beticola]|nr:unnamed protein product [Cercospora beticola]
MGRGGAPYISYTALILLSTVATSRAGLWDVDIDLSPAPPAESGPPFSANASRNRDILPYQVIGVVGAYVASVLIIGSLLLTVGRRLRKRAQILAEQPTEMVKPTNKAFDNSPLSPGGSVRGWLRSKKSTANSVRSGKSNLRSPGGASVATFDSNVVEQDKERHKEALARVYDAVYANDESDAPPYPVGGNQAINATTGRPTLRNLDLERVRSGGSQPISPRSPKSPYYAVAPPKDILAQLSPRYKNDAPQSPMRGSHDDRTASYSSERTTESGRLRKKLNTLNIRTVSPPVLRDNHDGAREPLSPRVYNNPGPPPEPPSARTVETYPYTPTTPGTAASYPFPEDEDFDDIRDLPPAHPQRQRGFTNGSQPPYSPTSPGLPSSPAQHRIGSPPRRNTPAGNVDRPLALRQFNEEQKQMQLQRSQVSLASPTANQFPLSPAGAWNTRPVYPGGLLSPAIQQTVLQTRNVHNGPTTAGGTLLPYSPYFPGQMVTPVSARFTTRAERKQKEKEEKATRGAITEEDQVPDEEDLWRDGYR